jgi:hypothetical protein
VEAGGKIHSIGGQASGGGVTGNHFRYDPATNSWTTLASLPTARTGVTAAYYNGKIHVFGGSQNVAGTAEVATHDVYDVATGAWTTAAPMSVARGYMRAVALNEAYDPATDTWTAKAPLPAPLYYFGGGVDDGKIYALGGVRSGTGYLAEALQYDGALNAWTPLQPLPGPRATYGYGVIDGKLYLAFGHNGTSILSSTLEYAFPKTVYLVQKN